VSLLLLGALAVFGSITVSWFRKAPVVLLDVMVLRRRWSSSTTTAPQPAAVLVGLASGLFLPALGKRTWGWILLNGADVGRGAGAAALTYASLRGATSAALAIAVARPPASGGGVHPRQRDPGGAVPTSSRAAGRSRHRRGARAATREPAPFAARFLLGSLYLSLETDRDGC